MFVFSNKHYNAYGAGIRTHESPPITDQGSADVSNRRKLVGKKKQLSRTTWQRLRGFWEAETKIFLCSFDQNILKKSLIKVLISSPERNDQKQFVFCSTQILLFCLTNRIKICSFIFKVISTKDGDKVLLKNFCSKQNLPIISMLVKRWKLTTMIFGRIK